MREAVLHAWTDATHLPESEEASEICERLRAVAEMLDAIIEPEHAGRLHRTTSVLQPWVRRLGLRHQGVLISAVRGCDSVGHEHVSKRFVRALRADCLVSFARSPRSFIRPLSREELTDLLPELLRSLDELPLHYVMHLAHAAEVAAFNHPDRSRRDCWNMLYLRICGRLHLISETPGMLDERLGASEEEFAADQDIVDVEP